MPAPVEHNTSVALSPVAFDPTGEPEADRAARIDAALAFLELIDARHLLVALDPAPHGGPPAPAEVRAVVLPTDRREAHAWIASMNRSRNIYFMLNEGSPRSTRREAADILLVRGVALDLDAKGSRTMADCRAAVDALPIQPTLVTATGGGVQAMWLLRPPVRVAPGTKERMRVLGKRLESLCQSDAVHDLPRILRLPGTINWPGVKKREAGRVPVLAHVLVADGPRHTLEGVENAIAAAPIVQKPERAKPATKASGNIVLHPSVAALAGQAKAAVFADETAPDWLPEPRGWFDALALARKDAALAAMLQACQAVASGGRAEWLRVMMAAKASGAPGAEALARAWSQTCAEKYDAEEFDRDWRSLKPDGAVGVGSLIALATARGFDAGPWRLTAAVSPTGAQAPPAATDDVALLAACDRASRIAQPIPPRRWLHGSELVRGFVTVLAAPGGAGKTTLALALATSVVARPILGSRVWGTGHRALVLSRDDDTNELNRRQAAIELLHGVQPAPGTLALVGADHLADLLLAEADARALGRLSEPGLARLDRMAAGHSLIVLDALQNFVAASINDNALMSSLLGRLEAVARQHDAAVLLLAHHRKGGAGDGAAADAVAGAAAITNKARLALTLGRPTETEAQALGLPYGGTFFRLDDAKQNLAPATAARWFELRSVPLGNGTGEYPAGDRVAAVVPHTAGQTSRFTDPQLRAALAALAQGTGGMPFSPKGKGADNPRSFHGAVAAALGATGAKDAPAAAQGVVDTLRQRGWAVDGQAPVPRADGRANRRAALYGRWGATPWSAEPAPGPFAEPPPAAPPAPRCRRKAPDGGAPELAP
jgi:hypothetical protein